MSEKQHEEKKPRMPKSIQEVFKQIDEHPNKESLGKGTLWAYEFSCKGGYSHCTEENNQWARKLWKKLYLNEI